MTDGCNINDKCLACGSDNLLPSLDLGNQPLANSYLKSISDSEETYPLAVNVCKDCYHVQLSHSVDPEIIYKNYLYVTGTNNTIKEYSKWFAGYVLETMTERTRNILDIGCNDGTQLDPFRDLGLSTYGIDPAENIYPTSSLKHNVICDFFGPEIVEKVHQEFDAIIAQNVMAHNPNPLNFLLTCKELMSDHTMLYVQTSQADMILNDEFDTIYHEHINFFNVNSMNELAKRAGINLIDMIKTPIHGNSYIFVFSKTLEKPFNIQNKISMESKLYSLSTYKEWENTIKKNMAELAIIIGKYRKAGYKIIGHGAAAKGNTMLNYSKIKLDLILDDNPIKQKLYTPGSHILITKPEQLNYYSFEDKILFVPLAWNFFTEISKRIKSLRNVDHDLFLTYFPEVKIVNV